MKNFRCLIAGGLLCLPLLALAAGEGPLPDTIAQRALACTACHGKEGRATSEGYFPRIAGKPAGYLYNQLVNFREGRRQYPAMTWMVAHLSDAYLKEIADYFGGLHLPYPPPQSVPMTPAEMATAQKLVKVGDPARRIPACAACHGPELTGALPTIPSTVGLPRDYLAGQLGAWKNGTRRAAAPDCMAQIAHELTPEEIGAVASWLATRPVPAGMAPLPAPPADPERIDASRFEGTYATQNVDLTISQDADGRIWAEQVPKSDLAEELGEEPERRELVHFEGDSLINLEPLQGMHIPHVFLGDDGEGHAQYLHIGRAVRRV